MVETRTDADLERQVLGAALLDETVVALTRGALRPEDFAVPAHGEIWDAMLDLDRRRVPLDVATLSSELRARDRLNTIGGNQYLGELTTDLASPAHAETHAAILVELAVARRLERAGAAITAKAADPRVPVETLTAFASKAVADAALTAGGKKGADMFACADAFLGSIEDIQKRGPGIIGVPTGVDALDTITSGWQDDQLVILAGRPATGKTSLVTQGAEAIARTGRPVLFFSLEMGKGELFMRMACGRAGVDSQLIKQGLIRSRDMDLLVAATNDLAALPITVFDDGIVTVDQIRAQAIAAHARQPLGAVVIDYLQLMTPPKGCSSREQEVSQMSRALKLLAKELHRPVVCLSQLNRKCEERSDKRPMLSDLRDSGAIEQDADVVVFTYRDWVYDKNADREEAELIVAKQRGAPPDTARVRFEEQFTRFGPRKSPRGANDTGWADADAAE